RRCLTTVMFHRILPKSDPRADGADLLYTISIDQFRSCLAFFRQHYSVIDLDQLSGSKSRALPSNPLLITFDDGWADNCEYALPRLQASALPAVVFVAAAAVGQRAPFWQEAMYAAWRTGRISVPELYAQALTSGLLRRSVGAIENSEAAL